MADAINEEELYTSGFNEGIEAERLRELYPMYLEYMNLLHSFRNRGFKIDDDGDKVKIWKEI